MRPGILDAVREILPEGSLLPASEPVPGPSNASPPPTVVAPSTEEQVAALLERASREGWRIQPAGLGTWLDGGGRPEADLVVSTRKLKGMQVYEPADLTFTAGAGTPWPALRDATRSNGQWLPLDPPGVEDGTLGAMVATGVSGPLRLAYGAPRDHVLGVTLVSGDGRILKWGGRVVKNVAGFDVTRLSVGSFGALGVITSVSARLFPLPARDLTVLVSGTARSAVLSLARSFAFSPLPLSAVEFLDPISAVWPRWEDGLGRVGLAARILGSEPEVREMRERVQRSLLKEEGVRVDSLGWLDGQESRAFHAALGRWETGAELVLRWSLLPSRMEELLAEAEEIAALLPTQERRQVRLAGHVGWGVLRAVLPRIPSGVEERTSLTRALEASRARVEEGGGSLAISQGPPELLQAVGSRGSAAGAEARLVEGLKAQFDPSGILSRGRFSL